MANKTEKKDSKAGVVPEYVMTLRADDPTAIGTIKNRMRLLSENDKEERAKLGEVVDTFAAWGEGKEKGH